MSSFDRLTRELTAFENQDALLNAAGTYRPTIRPRDDDRRYEVLADAYDAAQAGRGDTRRAYRGATDHCFEAQASVRLNGVKHGSGEVSDWLRVIWEVNTIDPGAIGEPLVCYWAHGGWTEEYPTYRVVLLGDEHTSGETADVVAFTTGAAAILEQAVARLGMGGAGMTSPRFDDDIEVVLRTAKHVALLVDQENGAPDFWDAVETQTPPSNIASLLRDMDIARPMIVTPYQARIILAWAVSLPEWDADDAPEYAPHPLLVQDADEAQS